MKDPRLQAALRHHQSGDLTEAARLYADILRAEPKNFDALYLLGFVKLRTGDFAAGERLIGQALEINPRSLDALYNRGRALMHLQRYTEALVCLNKALALNPNVFEVLLCRANVESTLLRYAQALADLDRAVSLKRDSPEAWNNRANVLAALGRFAEGVESYDRALALEPANPRTLNHRAITLFEAKRYKEAACDFAALLRAQPDFAYARGNLVYSRLHCCDWDGLEEQRAAFGRELRAGKPVLTPIQSTAISESPEEQLQASRIWTAQQYPTASEPLWRGECYKHDRIRLAYLSADFHSHATAALMAGVFETHDRTRFETIAISYGRDDRSPMRARLRKGFERFIDVREKSDLEIAKLLRESEVDIAIDLKGYTQESRPGILAHRAAPVQAQYLGFPGTMGARYIDYILADNFVIPDEQSRFYDEKIVYLPDSYQCNDRARRIAKETPSREAESLPSEGFVFCPFNNNYKIMPRMFEIWMRLLGGVEESVLWLLEDNAAAVRNLKAAARSKGVADSRLVFAPRANLDHHLARHRLADLFLDTLPYNAHTTASDALWAGLPVLTCLGTTFAGRVAASLLHAVGLPEMVTSSLEDYETLALKLAHDATARASIKAKLSANRDSFPLFDTVAITRHLESAYATMHGRANRGERPLSFAVDKTAS